MGKVINPNILVIGGGASAILSAKEIAKKKLPVWIADSGEGFNIDPCFKEYKGNYDETLLELKGQDKVFFLENAKVTYLKGTSGEFQVELDVDGEVQKNVFGAIVVATSYEYNGGFSEYSLNPSENILSQGEIEEKLGDLEDLNGKVCVFLLKYEGESNPVSFKRAISSAIALSELNAKVYVIAKNLKVGAHGLEKLVSQAKEKGVLILKPMEKPEVTADGGLSVRFLDSVIKEPLEIETDFMILEDDILPSSLNGELAEILRIHIDDTGFLQTNNVRRIPVYTNRKGIFAVGSATDIKPFYKVVVDAIDVGVELDAYFNQDVEAEIITIDRDKCVCCLTCYRICPHGAIEWKDERVVISQLACEECGTCAAECPMDAIELKSYSDDTIKSQIMDAISESDARPVLIGFCCKNSVFEAFKGARIMGEDIPGGFKAIKVPCAGKIDVDYVLEALAKGADGVIIGACYNGNCKSEKGTILAKYRTDGIRDFLKNVGLNPDKVQFINVASNMAKEFSVKVKEVEEKLK